MLILLIFSILFCSNSAMELSTVSALKDACQTAYNKGFWEYEDKVGEFQIVNPTLPANGDFSIYHMSGECTVFQN